MSPSDRVPRSAQPPCRVLVVHTNELIRLRWATLLRNAGYEVWTAESAREGISELGRIFFSIVLADCRLQDSDTLTLCQSVRQRSSHYIYLLMLTSQTGQQDLVAAVRAGADSCLSQSISAKELLEHVAAARRIGQSARS